MKITPLASLVLCAVLCCCSAKRTAPIGRDITVWMDYKDYMMREPALPDFPYTVTGKLVEMNAEWVIVAVELGDNRPPAESWLPRGRVKELRFSGVAK